MNAEAEMNLDGAGSGGRAFGEVIPTPQALEQYNEAVPGLADRIIELMEEEGRHRRDMEVFRERHDSKVELRGQTFAVAISLLSFVAAVMLATLERSLFDLSLLVTAVSGLSGLFLWTRSRSTRRPLNHPSGGAKGSDERWGAAPVFRK